MLAVFLFMIVVDSVIFVFNNVISMDLFQQLRAFHFCFILKGMEHLNTYKREKSQWHKNSFINIPTCGKA